MLQTKFYPKLKAAAAKHNKQLCAVERDAIFVCEKSIKIIAYSWQLVDSHFCAQPTSRVQSISAYRLRVSSFKLTYIESIALCCLNIVQHVQHVTAFATLLSGWVVCKVAATIYVQTLYFMHNYGIVAYNGTEVFVELLQLISYSSRKRKYLYFAN